MIITDLNDLYDQRSRIVDQQRDLNDRALDQQRSLTRDEETEYKKLDSEYKRMTRVIDKAEQVRNRESDEILAQCSDAEAPKIGAETIRTADGAEIRLLSPEMKVASERRGWMYGGSGEPLRLGKYVKGMVTGDWRNADNERRALSEGTDSAGGHLVPAPLSDEVIDLARANSTAIKAGAQTLVMETETLKIPKVTADPTAAWTAENAVISASDPTFSALTLTPTKLGILVKLSVELFEDSPLIERAVTNAISQALGNELDRVVYYGSGSSSEPTGIENTASIGTVQMGANGAAITDYDQFIEAIGDVLVANGPEQGLAAVMAPRTWETIQRFKDTTNQPLVGPQAFQDLRKFTTSQIEINQTRGSASNASDIYLGDFRQVVIGMRSQVRLEMSTSADDGFAKHQVWLKATLRADIGVRRPDHLVRILGIIP